MTLSAEEMSYKVDMTHKEHVRKHSYRRTGFNCENLMIMSDDCELQVILEFAVN